MKTKFTAVIMAFLMCLLCGCNKTASDFISDINEFFHSEVYENIIESTEIIKDNVVSYVKKGIVKDYNSVTIKPVPIDQGNQEFSAYAKLTQNQKNLYSVILTAVSRMELKKIDITSYSQQDVFSEIVIAHRALMCDRPDIFWMPKTFSVLSNDKSDNKYLSFKDVFGGSSEYGFYGISADEKNNMQSELESVTNDVLNQVNTLTDDFSKELYIHDYICDSVVYDSESANALVTADENALTVYGALVGHKSICEGYSKAFQYLCGKAGINCGVVYGEHEGVAHMWNIVCISNGRYYVDTTFDDSSEIAILHTYFNVTKDAISKDRVFDEEFSSTSQYESCDGFNFFCPDCDDTEMNYYEKTGAYITYDCSSAVNTIIKANEKGKNCAELENRMFISSDGAFMLLKNALKKRVKLTNCYKLSDSNTLVVVW